MATSPDFVRMPTIVMRPLTETILDALRDAVVVVDSRHPDLPVIFANATARRCLSGAEDSRYFAGRSLRGLLGPDGGVEAVEAVLATLAVGVPSADRIIPWRFPSGDIEVSTELKPLQTDVSPHSVMLTFADPAAEASLLLAVDLVPQDVLILDRELIVQYANPGAAKTAGALAPALLGRPAFCLAPTSAVPREVFDRALAGKGFRDDAMPLPMGGVTSRLLMIDIQPLLDDNAVVGVAVLSRDVTDGSLQDRGSGPQESRFLARTELVPDMVMVAALDGTVLSVSTGVTQALGYPAGERRSQSLFDRVHPEDVAKLRSRFSGLAAGGAAFTEVYRSRHKDGSYCWLESHFVSALGNPFIRGVVVNSRDVTRRKRAETQLAQREEVFRLAADAVNGVVFEWDLGEAIVHRSRGVREVLGFEPEELAAQGLWSARIHPMDQGAYEQTVSQSLQSEVGWTVTYRIRDSRGRYRSMLERALVQRSATGQPLRAIGCAVDVSESKRLTDLMSEIQRTALMGGWEYNYAARELEWTDELFTIFETTREEYPVSRRSTLARCTPESQERLITAMIAAESGPGSFDLEVEITTLKHHRVWVRVIGRIEMLEGRPFRAFASVQNVQSRKLSQIALETSTDWLKLSMNMAHMHAWRWERGDDSLKFAIVDGQMMHLPRVFPGMKRLMARVHPQDRLAVRRAIDHAFEHHVEVREEFRIKTREGQYRSYATVAQPLFDMDNHPRGLVGVTQDVTTRREAERQLRQSEELLRATTANTADTLLLVDTQLRVQFVNRPVRELSIEQIIGHDIGELFPLAARAPVLAKLRAVLDSGETATYEFEVAVPGGAAQHFECRAVLVRDRGISTGISIAMRDITENRRLEREVLEISSRERHRIGRDLHDGLGQELTGVALMLRGLAKRVTRQAPNCVNEINEIVALVNHSIEAARSLARGLMPVNTDNGGLSSVLRTLAGRCQETYGIEVDYREELSPESAISEVNASHLYRIAQEALTNTARHGHASRVTVHLVMRPIGFMLVIADDGCGIDLGRPATSGMGLKIMQYRASMVGAKFEIRPNHPRGTVVRVTCDQPVLMSALQSTHAI